MQVLIGFFKSIGRGLLAFFTWFVGVPGLIVSAVAGFSSAVSSLYSSLTTGNGLATQFFSSVDGAVSVASQSFAGAPDIVKLASYALSCDILFDFVISVWAVFVTALVTVLTFFLVTVPTYLVSVYAIKLTAWFLCAVFPRGYIPSGVYDLSGIDFSKPVRNALKDGKYNPWLAS